MFYCKIYLLFFTFLCNITVITAMIKIFIVGDILIWSMDFFSVWMAIMIMIMIIILILLLYKILFLFFDMFVYYHILLDLCP
jgi:hypothetical protein